MKTAGGVRQWERPSQTSQRSLQESAGPSSAQDMLTGYLLCARHYRRLRGYCDPESHDSRLKIQCKNKQQLVRET